MFRPATDGLTRIDRAAQPRHRRRSVRLTAFGGGTGLPVLLAGVRDRRDVSVTAVVTVADDGGSSGRLRREMGVAPPGDLRNSLVALARDRRLAELFQHRLGDGRELAGHAIGNLVIAGLIARSRDLCAAVQRAGRMLRTNGTVYPASREAVTLIMRGTDGSHLHGE